MKISEVKQLISNAINEPVYDLFYICTDRDLYAYYIVYNNNKIRCICAIDEINGLVSGIWD